MARRSDWAGRWARYQERRTKMGKEKDQDKDPKAGNQKGVKERLKLQQRTPTRPRHRALRQCYHA